MNINGILNKISTNNGVRSLKINKEELSLIESLGELSSFAKDNDIKFIDLECNDEIKFKHYAEIENKEVILREGLSYFSSEFDSELGKGIHGADCYDETGVFNLVDKLSTNLDKKMLRVVLTYNGDFIKRIYGRCCNLVTIPDKFIYKGLDYSTVLMEDELYIFY